MKANFNKCKQIYIVLSSLLLVAMMGIIYSLSAQPGEVSSESSNSFGEIILGFLGIEVPEGMSPSSVPIIAGFNIRNCAHIFLYMCLGLTAFLFVCSLFGLKKEREKLDIALIALGSVAISFLYACFDELHQYFIGGRTATWRDVGIDTIGYTFMVAVCCVIYILIYNFKKVE